MLMKISEINQKISDWENLRSECRKNAVNAAAQNDFYFARSFLNQAKLASSAIETLETVKKNELKRRTPKLHV